MAKITIEELYRGEKYDIMSAVTAKEVSNLICCSPLVYSRYEREVREPDIDALCKLADYFNVTVDYIVCRTDKKD